jgi:hypothetical protein
VGTKENYQRRQANGSAANIPEDPLSALEVNSPVSRCLTQAAIPIRVVAKFGEHKVFFERSESSEL